MKGKGRNTLLFNFCLRLMIFYNFISEGDEKNYDLENTVTPVNVQVLEELLTQYKYNINETNFLIDGFKNGFETGYRGNRNVQYR